MTVGVVSAYGHKRRTWARSAWEGWCVGVVSASGVDGMSVRGVGGASGVGMDDGRRGFLRRICYYDALFIGISI